MGVIYLFNIIILKVMPSIKDNVIEQLKKQISDYSAQAQEESVGQVIAIGDGIAKVSGLSEAMMSEMIEFETEKGGKVYGTALNLEEDSVGVIILGDPSKIKEGDRVRSLKKVLEVPVGDSVIGRVVNALGQAIDGKGGIKTEHYNPIEKIAPGVIARKSVHEPVQTGIKSIDAMVPIGRGQRELIIGDRQVGKTAIAIDTILNQKGQNMKCIYVAIGQKESKIANLVNRLSAQGAMDYTTVVLAGAADPASMLYIAPYTGCAIAEYFLSKGEDALIIYDDLSKHAVAYREISSLLRRPPGREAYPGDVFYLHSRLLERACKLNEDHGGGSITALPIIETQAGDVSAYIPTNVISITDGQIFLESSLFNQGLRPAINAGLSVSRVGSAAQIKAMKKVAGKMRLEVAQYRELAVFAQFGSDLDSDTKQKLERGKRIIEVLKQDQYAPLVVEKQVLIFFAVSNGLLDDIPVEKVVLFEEGLIEYVENTKAEVLRSILERGDLDDNIIKEMTEVIEGYKETLDYVIKE